MNGLFYAFLESHVEEFTVPGHSLYHALTYYRVPELLTVLSASELITKKLKIRRGMKQSLTLRWV